MLKCCDTSSAEQSWQSKPLWYCMFCGSDSWKSQPLLGAELNEVHGQRFQRCLLNMFELPTLSIAGHCHVSASPGVRAKSETGPVCMVGTS